MLSDDRRHKEGQNGLSRNKNLKIMREDSRSRSLDNLSGSSSNDLNVKVFFFFSLSLNGCKDIAQRSTSVQRRLKSWSFQRLTIISYTNEKNNIFYTSLLSVSCFVNG